MNLRRVVAYFPAFAKGELRNPIGPFMSIIFPVILILIFGAIFANVGNTAVPLTVQNLDHNSPASVMFLSALNSTGTVSVQMVSSDVGNLSDYLYQHSLSAGLVIPAGFSAAVTNRTPVAIFVYTNPSAGTSANMVQGAIYQVANSLDLKLAGGTDVVTVENINIGSSGYKYIDYLVPGLIGFSALVTPMFSMVSIGSTWKKDKLFRELLMTPLSRSEWLAAALLWFILLVLVATGLLVAVGALLFGASATPSLLTIPFLVAGPVLFVSIGLLAGSLSSPESAGVVGNVITFPMMFLTGTFFPLYLFPAWLVPVAKALPLFYVIDGLNATMIFANPSTAYVDLVIVVALAIAFFVAATRVFKWRED